MLRQQAIIVQEDGTFRHEHLWRGAAVALPVFALRSRESVGAGEFQDLKKLVTLCHQAGMASLYALSGPPDTIACLSQHRHATLQDGCRNPALTDLAHRGEVLASVPEVPLLQEPKACACCRTAHDPAAAGQ